MVDYQHWLIIIKYYYFINVKIYFTSTQYNLDLIPPTPDPRPPAWSSASPASAVENVHVA